jgi:hypothetical protein
VGCALSLERFDGGNRGIDGITIIRAAAPIQMLAAIAGGF